MKVLVEFKSQVVATKTTVYYRILSDKIPIKNTLSNFKKFIKKILQRFDLKDPFLFRNFFKIKKSTANNNYLSVFWGIYLLVA